MRLRDQATWVILGAAVIAALALPWLFGAVWPNRHLIAALMRQQMATRLPSNEEAPSVTRGPTLSSGSGALVSEANLLATATPTTTRPTTSAQEWAFPLIFRQVPTPTHTPTPTKTRKPTPTPTPTLPWPEPLDKPPRSKLGLHVQWNNSPEIMEYVRRMKPAVVKSVGDYGFLAEVKEVSPTTLTLARTDRDQRMEGDPIAAARAYVAADLETYRRHPEVDYWEGINEPVVRGRVEWFAAFEAERVRAMAEHGLRTAIGAFSAGVPEWEDFVAFLPAVEAAKKHGGILTVHEYDAPDMARSIGAGLPGLPNHPHRGALTLRYRWWYEELLAPRGLVIPLVVSEAGVDGGITNRPGPKGRGWQDFADYWVAEGRAQSGTQAYLAQLAMYDAELQRDDYVIGFAVFTAGAMGDDWRSYDITDILRHIATYVVLPTKR